MSLPDRITPSDFDFTKDGDGWIFTARNRSAQTVLREFADDSPITLVGDVSGRVTDADRADFIETLEDLGWNVTIDGFSLLRNPRGNNDQDADCRKLDAATKRKWIETRTALMWKAPLFTHILFSMLNTRNGELAATFTEEVPWAATDGKNLILNPKRFFSEFTLDERVFVVAHEILHCILNHCALGMGLKKAGKVRYPDGAWRSPGGPRPDEQGHGSGDQRHPDRGQDRLLPQGRLP